MARTTATKGQEQNLSEQQRNQQSHSTSSQRGMQSQTTQDRQMSHQTNGRQKGGLRNLSEQQIARGLGWFSIGLGLAEIIAPERFAKLIGGRGRHTTLIRSYGLREITCGIGLLTQQRPAAWAWARVAGDALDLASLGATFTDSKAKPQRLIAATAAVAGVTALDFLCAQQLSRDPRETTETGGIRVKNSLIINSSPEELYKFWRNFQNLPRFMNHLESVQVTGDKRSHWVAKAPAGATVEWDAEITEDRPNEMIAWRSLEGADVDNRGSVRFERAPGGRGTIVKVDIEYNPPGGVIGAGIARLFGEEPSQQVQSDLRRFKQVIETGEVV
ncbi:MAG TPA: SRPBCC family protein, partial [Blastocatellia bacterium]|nr:SRPBCC family protein [Blastocatellia bacterium]